MKKLRSIRGVANVVLASALGILLAISAFGGPIAERVSIPGGDDSFAVSASRLVPVSAICDVFENTVQVRVAGQLRRTLTSAELSAFSPWMFLDGGPDGPSAAATSAGGQVYISVHDDRGTAPSDVILKYDPWEDELTLFSNIEVYNRGDAFPFFGMLHHGGKLYVSTVGNELKIFSDGSAGGTLLDTVTLPGGGPIRGFAVDVKGKLLIVAGTTTLYRVQLGGGSFEFEEVGSLDPIHDITFSDHYGSHAPGLFSLHDSGVIQYVSGAQLRGDDSFSPQVYWDASPGTASIAATSSGELLLGAGEDAYLITDNSDPRMSQDDWVRDEFEMQVRVVKSLILDSGYVIDAEVQEGWELFHPASCDAALWAIYALILADKVSDDPEAEGLVEKILIRYSGMAGDGNVPAANAAELPVKWIDPTLGETPEPWKFEYATLSGMKLVLAAVIGRRQYPANSNIRTAANRIISRLEGWGDLIDSESGDVFFEGLEEGGPDPGTAAAGFHEGAMLVELLGGVHEEIELIDNILWSDPNSWPTVEIGGRTIVTNVEGTVLPAFVYLYSNLFQNRYRNSDGWQRNLDSVFRAHLDHADSSGPYWFPVFSAGTTKPEWSGSGYHADSLTNRPGEIATFSSVLAFGSSGDPVPVGAAYQAYRTGGRQTFRSGASLLYRRSNVDLDWVPNSMGLPDSTLALSGLAEMILPGAAAEIAADLRQEAEVVEEVVEEVEGGDSPPSSGSKKKALKDTWSSWYELANSQYGFYASFGDFNTAAAIYYYYYGQGYYNYYLARGNTGRANFELYAGYANYYYYYYAGLGDFASAATHYNYNYAFAYYNYFVGYGDYGTANSYYNYFISLAFGDGG